MLAQTTLQQFTKESQTDFENILREYLQHLFLSYFYQNNKSDQILFKGGTALRIVLSSPRFSEDLDFTGINVSHQEIENIINNTLNNIEKSGIEVDISESKQTSGGFLAIVTFNIFDLKPKIQIEISLRKGKNVKGEPVVVQNIFIPSYVLVQMPLLDLINEKILALLTRQKPRDFYDYYYLLSNNYPQVKEKENLQKVLELLKTSKINFRSELRKFLPISHYLHLKNFKEVLEQKIKNFL